MTSQPSGDGALGELPDREHGDPVTAPAAAVLADQVRALGDLDHRVHPGADSRDPKPRRGADADRVDPREPEVAR